MKGTSSYRECGETMYNCTAEAPFLVIAYVLVSRGSLRFAQLSVSVAVGDHHLCSAGGTVGRDGQLSV